MAEIVKSALADRAFVRWSVACLLLVAVSWWIQDQTNFISLSGVGMSSEFGPTVRI